MASSVVFCTFLICYTIQCTFFGFPKTLQFKFFVDQYSYLAEEQAEIAWRRSFFDLPTIKLRYCELQAKLESLIVLSFCSMN